VGANFGLEPVNAEDGDVGIGVQVIRRWRWLTIRCRTALPAAGFHPGPEGAMSSRGRLAPRRVTPFHVRQPMTVSDSSKGLARRHSFNYSVSLPR